MSTLRTSNSLRAVLRSLLEEPDHDHYGLELAQKSEIIYATIYPILVRLEAEGWVTGEWEVIDESKEGRRRRRYYRLTSLGQVAAEAHLESWDQRLKAGRLKLGKLAT